MPTWMISNKINKNHSVILVTITECFDSKCDELNAFNDLSVLVIVMVDIIVNKLPTISGCKMHFVCVISFKKQNGNVANTEKWLTNCNKLESIPDARITGVFLSFTNTTIINILNTIPRIVITIMTITAISLILNAPKHKDQNNMIYWNLNLAELHISDNIFC